MSFKELNISNPGTSTQYGGNDTDLINKLFNGVIAGIPAVTIKTQNKFGFWDNVLWVENQAATKKTNIRGQTNSPATDVDLALPPITGNDTLAAIGLTNQWIKQQFNQGMTMQEMSEPSSPAGGFHHLFYGVDGHLYGKNTLGAIVDYDNIVASATPKQYGAKIMVIQEGSVWKAIKADGTTVSSNASPTIAIQAALNGLTTARTWKEKVKLIGFPTITKLTFPSYTTFDTTDGGLFQANSTDTAMLENADTTAGNTDIELVGGVINGNRANQTGGGTEAISMIRMVKCSNVKIHNQTHINSNYHDIRLNDCPTGIIVINNIIGNFKQEGVSDQALNSATGVCHHHIISNNYSYHSVGQPAGSCHVATVNVSDLVCANNTWQHNIGGSGTTFNGLRNIIATNTITDIIGAGIVLAQGTTSEFDSSGSIVIGNTVKNCGLVGIHIQNGYDGKDYVIANNIVDTTGTITTTVAGINVQDQFNALINGNVVKKSGGSGIFYTGNSINQGAKHAVISNNICYNNGIGLSGTDTNRAGIAITANSAGFCNNVSVHGNHCYDDQGTQTQKYGARLSFTTDCIIKNNDFRGNLTNGMLISSDAGSKIFGNLGWLTETSGSSTQSGDNTTKVFNIAHGLVAAPVYPNVVPSSDDAMGIYKVTADATNITVTYAIAPPSGSSNLIWKWRGEV